jgi:hypothetical protein
MEGIIHQPFIPKPDDLDDKKMERVLLVHRGRNPSY